MEQDTKCFYCGGKGKRKLADGCICTCSVCKGFGIDFKVIHQKKHQGKNKCKYCGRNCTGYACESCLDAFEKEKGIEK